MTCPKCGLIDHAGGCLADAMTHYQRWQRAMPEAELEQLRATLEGRERTIRAENEAVPLPPRPRIDSKRAGVDEPLPLPIETSISVPSDGIPEFVPEVIRKRPVLKKPPGTIKVTSKQVRSPDDPKVVEYKKHLKAKRGDPAEKVRRSRRLK